MRMHVAALVIAAWPGGPAPAQVPNSVFRVAGVVVDATSGEPLKHARVMISRSDSPDAEIAGLVTGANGRFQFEVPKGKYQLAAERSGLWRQIFSRSSLGTGFGTAVVVDSGQQTDSLTFRIFPPGAISGRVTDEWGEPVENALVQLAHSWVFAGRKRTGSVAWAYTNDLGEYRFGRLAAGTYYLAVTGRPWYEQERPEILLALALRQPASRSSGPRTAYVPQYYPNAADARGAAPLVIKAGQEATANFSLFSTSGFTISVQCEGRFSDHMRLTLMTDGIEGINSYQRVVDMYGQRTIIPAVPRGRYTAQVVSFESDQPAAGSQIVDIVSGDVEITIPMRDLASVGGRLQFDSENAGKTGSLLVTLWEEATNRVFSRNVNADGTFKFTGVVPGKYRVAAGGSGGFFAKEVAVEGATLKDGVVEIGNDAAPQLKITVSNGTGRVRGFVYHDGQPMPGAMVILVPKDRSKDPGRYRAFQSDGDGSFDFQNVRPGDYHLFAAQNTEIEYANLAAVGPYLPSAKELRIEARGSYTEQVEVQ